MIALLAIMLTVLSLIIAIVGVFGYQAIRDEAKKRAEQIAEETAKRVATATAQRVLKKYRERAQASGLGESQMDDLKEEMPPSKRQSGRTKAFSDKTLKR